MYLLVLDYGYEGYSTYEYNTLDELSTAVENNASCVFGMYEIARELNWGDIEEYRVSITQKKAAAIEKAKSKLTTEELELLGIK